MHAPAEEILHRQEFRAVSTSTGLCRCKLLKVQPGITVFERPGDFHTAAGRRGWLRGGCSLSKRCEAQHSGVLLPRLSDPWLPAQEPSLQLSDKDYSRLWMKFRCIAVIVAQRSSVDDIV